MTRPLTERKTTGAAKRRKVSITQLAREVVAAARHRQLQILKINPRGQLQLNGVLAWIRRARCVTLRPLRT